MLGAALALVALEAAVRIAGVAPPVPVQYADNVRDEVIAFRRRPGSVSRGTAESGEFPFLYEHNSLGFRDTEHALAKAPGTVRIVALGDSFTYGVGADFADTYLARVERQLNERPGAHPAVEIIKLGMPRFFPLLERRTLEQYGLAFAPDVVMVTLLPNDIIDTRGGLDPVCVTTAGYLVPCRAMAWGEVAVWVHLHSALGRMVLQAWSRLRAGTLLHGQWMSVFMDDGPYEPAWRSLETELGRMQEAANSRGASFVVVALPPGPPWRDAHAHFETRLGRWSAAHGALFVPTLAAFRAATPSPPLYWARDGHCTPAGYAIVADAISAALSARGLTP